MSTQDVHAPTLGASGEPCATCGALLAADQRYCLNCGARRTDARIAFKEILATNGAAVVGVEGTAGDYGLARPAGAPSAGPPPASPPRDGSGNRSALAALGGLACLLLALGVGVLIGNSGKDKTAAAPAPQVISVGGAAAGTSTGASGTTTPGTTTPSSSSSGSSSKSGGASSSGSSGSSTSSGSKATNKSLQNLQKLSPKAYQKQSTKLPKVVGTGGKPPPKDNKPAAGGGSFQTIG